MIEPGARRWGLVSSLWNGYRNLFPTRKTKLAVSGLVGLGVLTTFMELMAAQLFSTMITEIGEQPQSESVTLLIAFVVAFAGVKGVQYFQSVYRLTVFDRAFRRIPLPPGRSDAWRWPMAIALVGVLGGLARLLVIIVTVAQAQLGFGIVLILCSVMALAIVNRTGRKQYVIHHEFADAKVQGRPPSAGERIGTRVRAGERAGLVASIPILAFVAALGFGAVDGRIEPQSALLLFIAGRMAANMYGNLATSMMRYIRSEVNVEVFSSTSGAKSATSPTAAAGVDLSAALADSGALGEPPGQAVARLIDSGVYLGDAATVGRVARELGFGPDPSLGGSDTPTHSTRIRATAANEVWCLYSARALFHGDEPPQQMRVVVDVFSRALMGFSVGSAGDDGAVERMVLDACDHQGVAVEDLTIVSAHWLCDTGPTVHDLLKALGVLRALRWSGGSEGAVERRRPAFPSRFEDRARCDSWLAEFARWYNNDFYHAAIGYMHPADVHLGSTGAILEQRLATLRASVDERAADGVRIPQSWLPPSEAFVEVGNITTVQRSSLEPVSGANEYDLDEP